MDPVCHNKLLLRHGAYINMADHISDWLTGVQINTGGDMVMDDYDIVNEKPEVAIITPDDATPDVEHLADDCKCTGPSSSRPVPNCIYRMQMKA